MKKGKLKKILATSAMGIMALAMPFALTGCDKDSDINVRVDGNYIQWQVDGSDSWTNLLSVEEVKDLLGESYKGDTGAQGNPGINGKEVEFRKSETHIQWRYVDNSQEEDENWENLISLTELKGSPGQDGSAGDDGLTPFIGINGNWWIGETDTGVNAEGQDGYVPTIEISSDGYWVIDGDKTSYKAVGKDGQNYVEQDITLTLDYNLPQTLSKFDISNETKYPTSVKLNRRWYVYSSTGPSSYFSLPDFANTVVEPFFKGWFTGVGVNERQIYNKEYLPTDTKVYAIWDTEEIYRQIGLMNQFDKYSLVGDKCVLESLRDESLTTCETPTIFINDTGVYSICIKAGCFDDATSLEKIILGNENFADSQGVVYSDIYTQVFNKCTKLEEVIISDNVRYIQAGLFDGCENLSKVKLSSQTRLVGYKAFGNCKSLNNIYLPDSVLYINESAFKGTSISEIYLPSRLQTLGPYAFAECKNLTKITIPSKITILQEGLFDGCLNLEEVILSNVKTLESHVFSGCEKLSVLDTSNITTMEDFIFGSCSSLSEFIIGGTDDVSFDDNSFEGSGFTLLNLIVDNELVANSFEERSSYGYVLALITCNTVYIKSDFDVANSTYLLENFTKQLTSDKTGYDMYVKNS